MNSIVFLRQLEYYRGLMFLTTNRLNAIDPAFKSRIDLILPYYDLDEPSRQRVWKNFINLLGHEAADLSGDDIRELAKSHMNGREIKNTIKTALILAAHGKPVEPLRLKHLNTVLNVRKRVADFEQHDSYGLKRQRIRVCP
jgi:SpoVK/Ycf46/Vps4 family AAA+-type ATPase